MTIEQHASNHGGRRTARAVVFSAAVVATDQATKIAVLSLASFGLIHPLRNDSFVLGLFDEADTRIPFAAVLAMAAVIAVLVSRDRVGPEAGGLLAGGALANIIDRLVRGSVIDWLPVGDLVMNLADLAIVSGLIALGARAWSRHHRDTVRPAADT